MAPGGTGEKRGSAITYMSSNILVGWSGSLHCAI